MVGYSALVRHECFLTARREGIFSECPQTLACYCTVVRIRCSIPSYARIIVHDCRNKRSKRAIISISMKRAGKGMHRVLQASISQA
jgi:hypothetical protein